MVFASWRRLESAIVNGLGAMFSHADAVSSKEARRHDGTRRTAGCRGQAGAYQAHSKLLD